MPEPDKKIYKYESNGFGDSSWYYVFLYDNPEKIKIIEDMLLKKDDEEVEQRIKKYFDNSGAFCEVKEQERIDFEKEYFYAYYKKCPECKMFTYVFWIPESKKMYIIGIEP